MKMSHGIVLDASATLAWLIKRVNHAELKQSDDLLQFLRNSEALVPNLWYPEVANGVLVAERRGHTPANKSAIFLNLLATLQITLDEALPSSTQDSILALARTYGLTGYDAVYLELVLRTGYSLATFDRQLADAVRRAGGRVFGDPE